jgi:polyphosphate kinase
MGKNKMEIFPILNRELAWLDFNDTVLEEANDSNTPIIERLRFLGIVSNNRDEFYRVRVATVKRLAKLGSKATKILGDDPQNLLVTIQNRIVNQQKRFDKTYQDIISTLSKLGVHIINETELSAIQKNFALDYFHQNVKSRLFPILLNKESDMPELTDQSGYLFIKLKHTKYDRYKFALVEIPTQSISRFIVLPSANNQQYVILLDDIIRLGLSSIFLHLEYKVYKAFNVKLTRDAELDIDTDLGFSITEKLVNALKKRQKGTPVRFVYDKKMPADMLSYIQRKMKLADSDDCIPGGRYHNFKDFIKFPDLGHSEWLFNKQIPKTHPDFLSDRESTISTIFNKDILLTYPYQSFQHILQLLREASLNPKVKSIMMTLYRVADASSIINALINAKKNRKRVVVVIELQARFDEENNIEWSTYLQEAGIEVIHGSKGLKVHSKLILIEFQSNKKLSHIAHIGTGNFNERTAQIYSDHTLLTANESICSEVKSVFDFYLTGKHPKAFKKLLVAPFNLRSNLEALINQEIQLAKQGHEAYIKIKLNNLVDRDLIISLYKASKAGVKIELIVRGICCIQKTGDEYTNNIEIKRIVDRYLEHSRILIFGNKGVPKVYIGSADWMPRNLDHRSEVVTIILDESIKDQLIQFFNLQFESIIKTRHLYKNRIKKADEALTGIRFQNYYYNIV